MAINNAVWTMFNMWAVGAARPARISRAAGATHYGMTG